MASLFKKLKSNAEPEEKKAEVKSDEELDLRLIQSSVAQFFNKEQYSDCTFVIGNKRIPAHRTILAARSPVFEAMLYPQFDEPDRPVEVQIVDTEYDIFLMVLQALYTDKVAKIHAKQVAAAINAAKKYQAEALSEACINYMRQGLSPTTACEVLQYAPAEDRQFALRYIEDHTEAVAKTDGWLQLNEDEISLIARSNRLTIDELDLFHALVKWGKKEMTKREVKDDGTVLQKLLRPVMQHVRFPLMTTEDLASVIAPTGVLDQTALVELFTFMASTSKKKSISRFCAYERQPYCYTSKFKWDPKNLDQMIIRADGLTVEPMVKSCARGKYVVADQPFPKDGMSYFEVKLDHTGGCYDAIGVTTVPFSKGNRLGTNNSGWAMRCYGQNNTSTENNGCIHNGRHQDFHKDFKPGDMIGVLYNGMKGSLTFFKNGQSLGTPFTDVKGQVYACIEMCHLGTMAANFKARRPMKFG